MEPMVERKRHMINAHLTGTLKSNDPRADSPEFIAAKKKEIKELLDKGTWKLFLKEEVPGNSNVLNGRFVLATKNKGTNEEIYKLRLVAKGHRDRKKHFLEHDSPNLRQSFTRLLVAIAAICDFGIWSHDVRQSYLQSSEKRKWKVYLNPSNEFELSEGEILEL